MKVKRPAPKFLSSIGLLIGSGTGSGGWQIVSRELELLHVGAIGVVRGRYLRMAARRRGLSAWS